MAIIKLGSNIADIRKKLGGHVFSKNRGGNYIRMKVTPVNPRTAFQSTVRARFAQYSSNWRGLTVAQQQAWQGAVTSYQKSNIFGDLHSPSGLNLYQRLNQNLLSSGGTAINTPAANKGVLVVTAGVLTYTSGTPALSLAYSANIPAATRVKIFATPPLSAGINFVKSQFRLISTLAPAAVSPANLLTAYNAKYGSVGAVGTKIFVAIQFVDQVSGMQSPRQIVSAVSAS